MKNFIGVLLFVWAGGLLVSCAIDDTGLPPRVQELTTGLVQGCESATGPAVSLMAEDSINHLALNSFKIKYRINGGDWRPEVEVTDLPYTIVGPAGKYDFEIRKEGYPLHTATILVPQEENCGIIQKELDLYLNRPVCPPMPSVMEMKVTSSPTHVNGLDLMLTPANDFREPIHCDNPNSCHFNIELSQVGNYVVEISGFQNHKDFSVIDGIVQYSYTDVTIEMNVNGNYFNTIASEGISDIVLTIPYNFGDSGCYEVDFNNVTIDRAQVATSDPDVIESLENRPFRIGMTPSNSCPGNMEGRGSVTVDYKVFLPSGTRISDVKVEYFSEEGWREASCREIAGYTCSAVYPNPFYGERYQVRAFINDRELIGSNFSLENKCILFD